MKLLIVDGNSIVNRAFYGIKALTTQKGEFTNAIFGFLMILRRMLDDELPDYVAVAFDVRQATFRHKLYDGYKANRKGMPKELASQMTPLKELLKVLGYQIITCPGYEADDIIGTIASACREQGVECVISTGDRDSFQLIGGGVTVRLAGTQQGKSTTTFMDEQAIFEKYKIRPEQMIDVKALMGDASDNIPGVPGVGEKTALSLIEKYGTLEEVYKHTSEQSIGLRKKLEENRDLADLSRVLAKIDCAVPIETKLSKYIPHKIKKEAAAILFGRLEMYRLQKKWGIETSSALIQTQQMEFSEILPDALEIVTINDLPDFLESGCDCLYYRRENGQLAASLVCNSKLLFADTPDILDIIWENSESLRVWNSKEFYKETLARNKLPKTVAFDGQLAAYLLNPLGSRYAIQDLAVQYGIRPQDIRGPIPASCIGVIEDTALVQGLFNNMTQQIREQELDKLLWEVEIPLARVLSAMEWEGFSLDTAALEAYGIELDERLANLQTDIYKLSGKEFNINSPRQLADVLFVDLALPPKKKTKTGYSTNAEVLIELKDEHPVVAHVLNYRQLAKLKTTYVDGLHKQVDEDDRVRTTFQQTETRTGRISSTEPNLQNIPVRTAEGSRLRAFFRARSGWKLLDADYSQIELRVLAHMANDETMRNAFIENQDIHTLTASQVFHMPLDMVTPEMRFRAKAVNFGIVYGIGAFSLAQDIGVSITEADEYIKKYLDTYPGVKKYMEETIEFAREKGYVKTMFGRRRHLPELVSSKKMMRAFGERIAMNMPIQGTAADIIKIAMIRVFERLEKEQLNARLILQVHDELLVEAPENEVDIASKILAEEMENAIKLTVPLSAETHVGKTWLEAK